MYWLVNDSRTERKVKRNWLGSIFTNKLGQCGEEGERGKEEKVHRRYLSPEVLAERISYRAHRQSTSQVPRQFPSIQSPGELPNFSLFPSHSLNLLSSSSSLFIFFPSLHSLIPVAHHSHPLRPISVFALSQVRGFNRCGDPSFVTLIASQQGALLSQQGAATPYNVGCYQVANWFSSLLEDLQSPCPIPSNRLPKDIPSRRKSYPSAQYSILADLLGPTHLGCQR